jgi:hypothetical protein
MHRPISNDEIGLTNQQRHVGAELGGALAPFTHEGSPRRLERFDRICRLELHLHCEPLGIRNVELAIWPVEVAIWPVEVAIWPVEVAIWPVEVAIWAFEHQAGAVLAHGADHRVALHLAQQIA